MRWLEGVRDKRGGPGCKAIEASTFQEPFVRYLIARNWHIMSHASVVFVSLKIPLQQPVIGSQDVDWGCLALGGVCPGGVGRIGVIRLVPSTPKQKLLGQKIKNKNK